MLKHVLLLSFVSILAYGYVYKTYYGKYEIVIDKFGTWVYPSNNSLISTLDYVVREFPRFYYTLSIVLPEFDLENTYYSNTNDVYILIMFAAGVIFLVSVYVVCFLKICLGKCGGIYYMRNGYKPYFAFALRYSMLLLSFSVVGILIYGYFANTDLHLSLTTLRDLFKDYSEELIEQVDQVIENIPSSIDNATAIKEDMRIQRAIIDYATNSASSYISGFETLRYLIAIFNSITATIGCAIGITAGSITGRVPLYIMIGMFAFSFAFFALSSAVHFAGAKSIVEFCDAIQPYLETDNDEYIPGSLQYFIRCFASPYLNSFHDEFIAQELATFNSQINGCTVDGVTPNYADIEMFSDSACTDINMTQAKKTAIGLRAVVSRDTCAWTKEKYRDTYFLLCIYSRTNLEMTMLTQFAGGLAIGILTVLGVIGIKVFLNAQKSHQKMMLSLFGG